MCSLSLGIRKARYLWFTDSVTFIVLLRPSELNVDKWNDNCEAKSEAKSPRPLRVFQSHT